MRQFINMRSRSSFLWPHSPCRW